jgi:two-component system OmpR family sensor kinase
LTTRLTVLATAATALVLLLVLVAVAALFSRLLDASVDNGLRARLGDLLSVVADNGPEAVKREALAELYDNGRVVASSATVGSQARLLSDPAKVTCPGPAVFSTKTVRLASSTTPRPVRVLAGCLPDGRVVAVAVSLEPQRDARERLLVLLALTAPVLLALVALTVWRAVHAALRPVDALSRQAIQITAGHHTARRLPTVRGDDEIARLAKTLDEMLARLAVAFAREQAFVDDASHELRTPIAVLRGEIELALSDLHDTAAVEHSLRAALAEARRLSRLAEDLLVLARQRTGSGHQAASPLQMLEFLTTFSHRLAPTTSLKLGVDCPPALRLHADRDRLERVLTNLVANAAAAGATAVRLTARAEHSPRQTSNQTPRDQVLLDVEDDGPGFPPDFLPSAFERFTRADVARTRTTSAGLGLALVHALVTDAGGTVSADNDSQLGGGTVRMRLPMLPPT